MYKNAAVSVLMAGALVLGGCAGLSPDRVVPEEQQDAVLATRVKAKLIEERSLDAAAIRVISDAGTVTLDGFVDSQSQKERAASLVRDVPGVVSVDNQLQVL